MSGDVGFVHLHVHSSFSLLESALTVGKLAELAKADKQPALALTDTDNMFGALEFSEKMAGAGIQPITGVTLAVNCDIPARSRRPTDTGPDIARIVLLAANEIGYANLMALTSRAFLDAPSGEPPHVDMAMLANCHAGLLALTGGPQGPIDLAIGADNLAAAEARLRQLQDIFPGRLYVELQRHRLPGENQREARLLDLAYALDLPLVATNQCYFAKEDDYEPHDALLCLAEGRLIAEDGRRRVNPEYRFKTRAEMMALFADLPEALRHTVDIARRCSYRPRTRKPILPRFAAGGAGEDEGRELRRQAETGLARRLDVHGLAPGLTREDYDQRLDFELSVIERMKYPGYFLIVSDFIKWAKVQGIPVGPGRGSGAGSLVAWSLTITDLDPLRFGLLFERFLNPERVSMPDFDIDFCQERRDEVIRYVQGKYGSDRVAQIITFGTLQARGVLRDVGRVLEMPYGQVDRLCKMVPQNPANPVTLAKAIEEEPRLQAERDREPIVNRAFDIALRLEGLYRHASTHAAGIVIGDRPLEQLVPLYRDPKSDMPVTQFNMKWVEPAGLVKFDFLGLKTLTVLQTAVDLVKRRGEAIDLSALPLDDKPTYDLLARAETVGIFQLESAGMRKAIADIQPDRFEDIIALVALYRPGPMANIPVYGARKHGHEAPDFIHPKLEPILKETHGIIVYQEQVMQIAQVLAGYSLGEADLLRRAMGKKIKAEMEAQRARFVEGCLSQHVEAAQAQTIFDLLAKFADYGFNKSHAAAYALVAYQTAWMKAHFPVEFLAASMTLDATNTDKLSEFRVEAQRLGIAIEPPCVSRSQVTFDVAEGRILYALAAVKGIGEQAARAIVEGHGAGAYRDLSDFAGRVDARMINRRILENLVAAGAFDRLEPNRARAHAAIDVVLATAQRTRQAAASGQDELFGASPPPMLIPQVDAWLPAERLKREFDAIGFFLSGHPLDDYASVLKRLRVQGWTEFARAVKSGATAGRLAGSVISRAERKTRTGNRMGIVGLSDASGHYEAVLFSEGLAQFRDFLTPGNIVLLQVGAELQGEEVRVRIQSVESLDAAAAKAWRGLRVILQDAPLESIQKRLVAGGDGEVSLVLKLEKADVEMRLKGRYRVGPQVAGALKLVPGVLAVEDL